ncbi:hypothetical protein QAD02_010339 [Eretmocerus hayati]|uniref:Uncharacterized protein n=1 Tax=Eretmocerus hayati TaxID=131215 RepID=A0ACC2NC55_9HYME|nr:hypothetical protein QAD02_010339 [Eretmocerus hayati]
MSSAGPHHSNVSASAAYEVQLPLLTILAVTTARPSEPFPYPTGPLYPLQPRLISQTINLNELPTKIVKVTRLVAVKVPVPYPVKVPEPVPVAVHQPVAVAVPQLVHVPHHVPVPHHIAVPVEKPVAVPVPEHMPVYVAKHVHVPVHHHHHDPHHGHHQHHHHESHPHYHHHHDPHSHHDFWKPVHHHEPYGPHHHVHHSYNNEHLGHANHLSDGLQGSLFASGSDSRLNEDANTSEDKAESHHRYQEQQLSATARFGHFANFRPSPVDYTSSLLGLQ